MNIVSANITGGRGTSALFAFQRTPYFHPFYVLVTNCHSLATMTFHNCTGVRVVYFTWLVLFGLLCLVTGSKI